MEKKLSTFQKGKIILKLIEDLKDLPNKENLIVDRGSINSGKEGKLITKISERAGVSVTDYYPECGVVNISEDISISLDARIDKATRKLNGESGRVVSTHEITFDVSEGLKEATEKFENENIPPSGPCKTLLGEIFRAIQRMQYRAFNDGDEFCDPASPSFMSYIFLRSQVDYLNYSSSAYNEETGGYEFEFTDQFLNDYGYDGKISDIVEDHLCTTANFIKYQIMDLLINGKLKDEPNTYDSRDYSSL